MEDILNKIKTTKFNDIYFYLARYQYLIHNEQKGIFCISVNDVFQYLDYLDGIGESTCCNFIYDTENYVSYDPNTQYIINIKINDEEQQCVMNISKPRKIYYVKRITNNDTDLFSDNIKCIECETSSRIKLGITPYVRDECSKCSATVNIKYVYECIKCNVQYVYI